ncbi:uncharacterized protein LOC110720652 isoform X1 [Chenopodium quinoa]|uniref:Insecticidal crystal toxin domain-containing protein n=2 Tax=Chenopodium quinoa TaxID=63459 RepID=A0A803KVB5_CHEQI|nr:uncharacterized protein LOC110720652 isoform X1 [Chenopodium quinoa]
MYVTRPISFYSKSPDSLSVPPPEGPNSGYLVIQDDGSLMPSCFGQSKSLGINDLPLPSNKILFTDDGDQILAVPVINQTLSSNRYYVIKAHKKHKGEAYACSKEEGKGISCGGSYIQDVTPKPLDPIDIYQQFEFEYSMKVTCNTESRGFIVKSIAPDGHAPRFLRNKSPTLIQRSTTNSKDFIYEEANGLNSSLREQLPDFNFPLSRGASEPVCVGKWYCPFMFIHEGKMKDQIKDSVYYEMTLEQRWERIFITDSSYNQGNNNKVMMDVVVRTQEFAVGGKDAVIDERTSDNKAVWFQTIGNVGEQQSVGLNKLIFERMLWEQERVGWVNGKEKQVRMIRDEEYGGIGWWARFGCYVLVERFVLKRIDGTVILTCDFKHTRQIKTNWE